ncbi:MAG: hypothetical protein R3E95_07685 [Thiolinea sp.]
MLLNIVAADSKVHYQAYFQGDYDLITLEWFTSFLSAEQYLMPFNQESPYAKSHQEPVFQELLQAILGSEEREETYQLFRRLEEHMLADQYIHPTSVSTRLICSVPNWTPHKKRLTGCGCSSRQVSEDENWNYHMRRAVSAPGTGLNTVKNTVFCVGW